MANSKKPNLRVYDGNHVSPQLPVKLPHDIEMEQAVLGQMMLFRDIPQPGTYRVLEAGHFYEPLHQQIYHHATVQMAQSRPVDPLIIRHQFSEDLKIGELTISQYLVRMQADAASGAVMTKYYSETLIKLYRRREVLKSLADSMEAIAAPSPNLPAIVSELTGSLRQIDSDTSGPPLTFFGDMGLSVDKKWSIEGVIAYGEVSSWYGQPGAGKSSLLGEAGIHLAAGIDWRGFHIPEPQGVVYFALERPNLVQRRLVAYAARLGLETAPIAVSRGIVDLLDPACVPFMVGRIKRAEDKFGCRVGMAIIDTWSKGIAAGGGDEDKAKDQNLAAANMRRVIEETSEPHIASAGHPGKDQTKGERGSSARQGDVDLEVQITGDIVKRADVKKANDQPLGLLTSFTLGPYDFDRDKHGEVKSVWIVSADAPAALAPPKTVELTEKQKLAVKALAEVLLARGKPAPFEYGLPAGMQVVAAEDWKAEMLRNGTIDPKGTNPRARYQDMVRALTNRCVIGYRDETVWLPRP